MVQYVFWAVWLFGVLYALFAFYQAIDNKQYLLDAADFGDGWSFLSRRKDVSDVEWTVLKRAFWKYWFLLIGQVVCIQLLLKKSVVALVRFYSLYSILSVIFAQGPYIFGMYMAYILLMYGAMCTKRKSVCYFLTVVSLLCMQQKFAIGIREKFVADRVDLFLVEVGFIWLIARALSFSLDCIKTNYYFEKKIDRLALVLSYCFYLPVFFTGPLITFELFANQIFNAERKHDFKLASILCLLHPLCAYFLLEYLLHYVYSSSAQFYPEIVAVFDSWSLCGLGYALPIMFYLKYFVIYSCAGAFAKMECIDLPPPPKCVSRVHVPSLLWRTFDRGLYLWILKYLYLPIIDGNWTYLRKLIALAVCFTFICIWHGMDKAVCTWTFLNFVSLVLEIIMSLAQSVKMYKHYESLLSPDNKKRMKAFLSTPHFILMCISSCFFLSNWDVGLLLLKKVLFTGFIPLLPIFAIMFSGCCVSIDIKEWEDNKNKFNFKLSS